MKRVKYAAIVLVSLASVVGFGDEIKSQDAFYFQHHSYQPMVPNFTKGHQGGMSISPAQYAHNTLAHAFKLLEERDYHSSTISAFNEAIRVNPNVAEAYCGRGVVRIKALDIYRAGSVLVDRDREGGLQDIRICADLAQQQNNADTYRTAQNLLRKFG